jgi:hypothetical protein
MPERRSLPRPDDLKKMPLRAIVAYAARCARRVQPLFRLVTEDIAGFTQYEAAVDRALSLAERFCVGDESEYHTLAAAADAAATAADEVAACAPARAFAAAANAARAAANAAKAAVRATAAADHAYAAATTTADHAAARDFEALLTLYSRGWFGRENRIDPTEHGPLGSLWPRPTLTPTAAGWSEWTISGFAEASERYRSWSPLTRGVLSSC